MPLGSQPTGPVNTAASYMERLDALLGDIKPDTPVILPQGILFALSVADFPLPWPEGMAAAVKQKLKSHGWELVLNAWWHHLQEEPKAKHNIYRLEQLIYKTETPDRHFRAYKDLLSVDLI